VHAALRAARKLDKIDQFSVDTAELFVDTDHFAQIWHDPESCPPK